MSKRKELGPNSVPTHEQCQINSVSNAYSFTGTLSESVQMLASVTEGKLSNTSSRLESKSVSLLASVTEGRLSSTSPRLASHGELSSQGFVSGWVEVRNFHLYLKIHILGHLYCLSCFLEVTSNGLISQQLFSVSNHGQCCDHHIWFMLICMAVYQY